MLETLKLSLLWDVPFEDQMKDSYWSKEFDNFLDPAEIPDDAKDDATILCNLVRGFCHRNQYRKKDDFVYQKVFVNSGDSCHFTHAYERYGEIKDMVMANMGTGSNKALTDVAMRAKLPLLKSACDMIAGMKNDVMFPVYNACQTQISFRDCIVDMDANMVYIYPNVPKDIVTSNFIDKPYLPVYEITKELDFDQDIGAFIRSWKEIKTPALDTILLTQLEKEDDKDVVFFWICALLGRLFFQVGQRDNWDLFIFFFGLSQTGKSLIMNQVRDAIGTHNVSVLKNTMQENFGIANLMKGTVVLGYEIDTRLNFSQTDLQSMVSGEPIHASVKFKQNDRVCETWKSHIAMCGNEVPSKWLDSANQLSRRCACIHNQVVVQNHNPTLKMELKEELPAFVAKTYLAYTYLTSKEENKTNFFRVAPSYFTETKDSMSKNLNSLIQFLNSRYVKLARDASMPTTEFEDLYNRYLARYKCDNKIKCGTTPFHQMLTSKGITEVKRTTCIDGALAEVHMMKGVSATSEASGLLEQQGATVNYFRQQ